MVTVRKHAKMLQADKPKAELTAAERNFFAAVNNPKPAPEYLKEMFRLYGRKPTED